MISRRIRSAGRGRGLDQPKGRRSPAEPVNFAPAKSPCRLQFRIWREASPADSPDRTAHFNSISGILQILLAPTTPPGSKDLPTRTSSRRRLRTPRPKPSLGVSRRHFEAAPFVKTGHQVGVLQCLAGRALHEVVDHSEHHQPSSVGAGAGVHGAVV